MLTRDSIRQADTSRPTQVVNVPQWGGDVLIRRLSVAEQERFWDICDETKRGTPAPAGKRGSVVYMACCDANGGDLWKPEDAVWLGSEANLQAVDLLYDAIMELSGVTQKAQGTIEKKPDAETESSSNGSATAGASGTSTDSVKK